jgi:hypothetical protein
MAIDLHYTGTAASGVMRYFGVVPASGVYATLQSAAMGGLDMVPVLLPGLLKLEQ